MRNVTRAVATVLACTGLLLATAAPAVADSVGAWKDAHDTDPHLPLTPEQVQMLAQKNQVEREFLAGRRSLAKGIFFSNGPVPADAGTFPGAAAFASLALIPDMPCDPDCGGSGGAPPATAYFAGNQVSQITSYYCGPAAGKEAFGHLGQNHTQDTLANWLGTTTNGTDWSNSSGYPFPNALNAHQSRNYYVPIAINSVPTSSQISKYKSDLRTDIGMIPAPLVGDAWEVADPSRPHLTGHPTNREIFHWFEIRGYQSSGDQTMYEDSVSGASSVSWSAGVPPYSTKLSNDIVSIIGGRGYVW